jgi:uncharacterized protein YmfQ (DUF2313 family)
MSSKTTHKPETKHGFNSTHRHPNLDESTIEALKDLSVQLYPTGRAFYKTEKGVFENFHEAINLSFSRLIEAKKKVADSLFPDNNNFTAEDAFLWEHRLGLISNENLSLETRKDAIRRKMGHPNNIKPRQSKSFIESQLRLSGFDVYLHENQQPYQTPFDVAAVSVDNINHSDETEHGLGTQHGSGNFLVVANTIEVDENYSIGSNSLWATFFIGGQNLGDYANVERSRLKEFKELIIKLKPAHTVAFIFINFV